MLTALVSLAALAALQRPWPRPESGSLEVVLSADDPALEGHGPSTTFAYTADFSGSLYVWAASDDLDPLVRLVAADRAPKDDGGGGSAACMRVPVEAGARLEVTVASARPGGSGCVRLACIGSIESASTRRAAEDAKAAAADAKRVSSAGDTAAARALLAHAVESLEHHDPDAASASVDEAMWELAMGAYGVRALDVAQRAFEHALRFREPRLPVDQSMLSSVRHNLASVSAERGDFARARELFERVLESRERTKPADDLELQTTRLGVAIVMSQVGELEAAERLASRAITVLARLLPEHHPALQIARMNLGGIYRRRNDLERARAVLEQVVDVYARAPNAGARDANAWRGARGNLASVLKALGDLEGARVLEEELLREHESVGAGDDVNLATARMNLANTLALLGEVERARALFESVVDGFARTLAPDHPIALNAAMNFAAALDLGGDPARALELQARVVDALDRPGAGDERTRHLARSNMAATAAKLGELDRAAELARAALEARARDLPQAHPDLQTTRDVSAWILAAQGQRAQALELARVMLAAVRERMAVEVIRLAPREAEAAADQVAPQIATALSLSAGAGAFAATDELDRELFEAIESARAVGLRGSRLARSIAGASSSPRARELRARTAASAGEVARSFASPDGDRRYFEALREHERAQRDLWSTLATEAGIAIEVPPFDAVGLSARLEADEAAIGYWRYARRELDRERPGRTRSSDALVAFVARRGRAVARVELGPAAPIDEAVAGWRSLARPTDARGIGVVLASTSSDPDGRAAGELLRKLVFDPLAMHVADCGRLRVALDDPLHGIALDALPLGEGLIGDRIVIEARASLDDDGGETSRGAQADALVLFGAVEYGAQPPPTRDARRFDALPASGAEIDAIARVFAERFARTAPCELRRERQASLDQLRALAPRARFLHVATHGYFAPAPIDAKGDRARLSPLVQCGLAFAGANGPVDAAGVREGIVTGQELAELDLSRCELAVLSACDTHVGDARAGQGVASLQRALHVAGARSVVSSVWKVRDQATRDLMEEFYRRLWIVGETKGRALWNAKMKLRHATDEAGRPRYSFADWAGWILSGDAR